MMSVWERYSKEEREQYIKFLKVYGALSNLFRQKHGDEIPYLDSKFQETIYARVFKSENVDIGNTPHDILSVFGQERIGIGLKTWMKSSPSFQKVMQLKSYKSEIDQVLYGKDLEAIAYKISAIKNRRMQQDYMRLGLKEDSNIYHYITRDAGRFRIQECSYPLVDLNNLQDFSRTSTSFQWSDGLKKYKYTYGDSQIFQYFDSDTPDSLVVNQFDVNIIDDPFEFLLNAYLSLVEETQSVYQTSQEEYVEAYLPLYSYRDKEVPEKSGLNMWNAASKNKGSDRLRPLNEVYIPIPKEFHRKCPDFFVKDIFSFEADQAKYSKDEKPILRFHIVLPNGKVIPGLITQQGMKAFQSGSRTERDENGVLYGQSALGQWLLVDVLGLSERKLVTKEWLMKRGTDSVRLWRKKDDYSTIYIDFAPVGAFERFMQDIPQDVDGVE